jgi:O-antigen/teichoic acid export membrane protein
MADSCRQPGDVSGNPKATRFLAVLLKRWAALAFDPITRSWAIVAGGSFGRLALGFIASVLIARSLGPADFGVYAVLAAVANIAGAFADLGLTDTAVKRVAAVWPAEPRRARERGAVFFWLRVAAVGVVVTAGLVFAEPLARHVLSLPEHASSLRLALIGVAATALSGAVCALLQATGRFARLTLVGLTNAALTAVLAAILALNGALTLTAALVVLGIGTSLASFGVGYFLLPRSVRPAPPAPAALRAEGTCLIQFGRWLWLANSLAMLAAYLDVLLLNHWLEPAVVASYALALNLATKVDVLNQSLYTVMLPAASSLDGRPAFGQYARRGLIRSALVGVALLPLLPLAEPFITFFYGPAYAQAVGLFQALLVVVP